MCLSGATCLPTDCCFSELALWNPTQCVGLVQSDLINISLKINLFSPWYIWEIAELVLNNNHSLYPCFFFSYRGDDEDNIISINCLKIVFDEELQLTLYRHWSLFDSIRHSVNMACKFKVWTLKGQKRLHEFLAEMG